MELYTIVAQIINFVVLIFLLNKFLYKPVLKTMDQRRKAIKEKIDETEKRLAESDRLKEEYLSKLKEVEEENVVLRKQAIEEIQKFKALEMQKARDDISSRKDKFNDYLELEQKNLIENFEKNLSSLFIDYSNSILGVLANSNLQRELVNNFVLKIEKLDQKKVDDINNLKSGDITIFSASELDDGEKNLINIALNNKGFKYDKLLFNTDSKLIIGIELRAKSYILSWNVKELTNDFVSKIDKKIGAIYGTK